MHNENRQKMHSDSFFKMVSTQNMKCFVHEKYTSKLNAVNFNEKVLIFKYKSIDL